MARWTAVAEAAKLAEKPLRSVTHDGRLLLLVRVDGDVHALDGRCPHEGYPLVSGDLKECTLTCAWHNWKFDVRDGACLIGGEGVRHYPARIRDGKVEVDLAEPDPAARWQELSASLEEALLRNDLTRAVRDGVRLLHAGSDPRRVLADVAALDARRAEYGCTHVLPVAADCARLLEHRRGVAAAHALAPVLEMCAESVARMPERPRAEPIAGATGSDLRAAVEAEDGGRAEGLLLGAFAAGRDPIEIESWLYAALSDHFLDFGHPLIYLVKLRDLLAGAGRDHARELYRGLLYGIVLGTREDTLPYWKPYRAFVDGIAGEFGRVDGGARNDAAYDVGAVRDAVLDGSAREACEQTWRALAGGVAAERVATAIVAAGAHRLLRFDPAVDVDPGVAENWLWATHRFTFASAVRQALAHWRSPDRLRFVFQAVGFIHSGRPMDLAAGRRATPSPSHDAVRPADVIEAIRARDADRAVAVAASILARGDGPVGDLHHALENACLDSPLVRPIFVAHAIKTTWAAFDERAVLRGTPDQDVPVLAAVRFLASPQSERRVPAQVDQAIAFVVEGKIPRKLTQ